MRRLYRGFYCAAFLFLLSFLPAIAMAESPKQNQVLLIYDGNRGNASESVESFDKGIRSAFGDLVNRKFLFGVEYTDLSNNPSREYLDQLVSLLKLKYRSTPPDLIIVNMDPYSELISRLCDDLFPEAKVVFSLYEGAMQDVLTRYPGKSTGVYFEIGHDGSPGLIQTVSPQTKNIFVIGGASSLEASQIKKVSSVFDKYSDRFKTTYLSGLSIEETLDRAAHLPKDSAIYFTTYLRDPAGKAHFSDDVLSLISKHASVPIFSFNDIYMGKGILGGELISSEELGKSIGAVALKILDGVSPADFKPMKLSGVRMFDWRQVRKWGIDENRLPEGSIIKYREYSFFEKYRWRIIFWISVVVLQFCLITYLLITLRMRRHAENSMLRSEKKYRRLVESTSDAIVSIDREGMISTCNRGATNIFGYPEGDMLGSPILQFADDAEKEKQSSNVQNVLKTGFPLVFESVMVRRDGVPISVMITLSVMRNESEEIIGLTEIIRDISEHKRAEEEKARLESALQRAQKLEAVGQLAGGVAHDFNNMLGIIIGYAEMTLEALPSSDPLRENLREIISAGDRSTNVVRQLLAFARKQTIAPKKLDLNSEVEDILKMLRRLIGEDIDLLWEPAADLWSVNMDPSQIDQLLANLIINARDAIRDVGKVTIETANRTVDAEYCATHPEVAPGDYVMLAVSDDGCGMDKEMQANIFDPFFTTKGIGKGTGLGLATVYGIVKQNKGFINLYSEPGEGSSFTLYFPRCMDAGRVAGATPAPSEREPTGTETVLLVEDEQGILTVVQTMLEVLGYTVLAAHTPEEAIRLAGAHDGKIHLLMTDVVMPEMNGRELARRLLSRYPDLKQLFMSGYTANVIAHHGVLEDGVHFIQKPFVRKDLANKVREVLNSNAAGQEVL